MPGGAGRAVRSRLGPKYYTFLLNVMIFPGAEQPLIIKIVEMTIGRMSSCSSVIADIVETTDEQELIPTGATCPSDCRLRW